MPEARGYPYDSYFKMPNNMVSTRGGWIQIIGPTGVAVYAFIAMRFNHRKQQAPYVSHRRMAEALGVSKTTLETKLKLLLAHRLIEKIPHGRYRVGQHVYQPAIPVPEPPTPKTKDGETGSIIGPKDEGHGSKTDPLVGQKLTQTGSIIGPRPLTQPKGNTMDKSDFRTPLRLYTRLGKDYLSPPEAVTHVLTDETVPLKTKAQVAWNYWCSLWEARYGGPYYPNKKKENVRSVPKDKRNLRDKIEAVGFRELVDRMQRCFEVCDELFPCRINGQWKRPIRLDDFVNHRFFNQWMPPPAEPGAQTPTSAREKLERTLKRHTAESGNHSKEVRNV